MRSNLALAAAIVAITTPAVAAETHVVTMAGSVYHPAKTLSVRVGDIIRFVNDDGTDHIVFVPTVGHAIDLGSQAPDEERELTVLKPGTFQVECANHEHMILTVEVTP